MSEPAQLTEKEVAAAVREAKLRGLPDGWSVKLDKRKRRKWIAPNGRTCDSIPKAIAMSIELGLLPEDAEALPAVKKSRLSYNTSKRTSSSYGSSGKRNNNKNKNNNNSSNNKDNNNGSVDDDDDDDDDEEDEEDEMEPPTNPETTLDIDEELTTTVHWDPNSVAGRKIGWRVRVVDGNEDWKDGRVIRYDPITHRHKVKFVEKGRSCDKLDQDNCAWLHFRMVEGVQVATRLVWAHVKGYAWWPAMVMESNTNPTRDGYVSVEFFGSAEVATLRNTPECIRPFAKGKVDNIIIKNKKKRNASAIAKAVEEEELIQKIRNEAARFYATKAYHFVDDQANNLLGKKIQIFRSDVNYPYGDTVVANVRHYSPFQKKWLLSFEISNKTKNKYDPAWINVNSKEHKMRILDKKSKSEPTDLEITPYLSGFANKTQSDAKEGTDEYLANALAQRCRGCIEHFKTTDTKISCKECQGCYHLCCADPPITSDAWQKIRSNVIEWTCSKCVTCRACYEKDIAFGSQAQAQPPSLSFPAGEALEICSACVLLYEKKQFCPNCAHSWDDERFQSVQRQIRWQQEHRPKKRGRKRKYEDPNQPSDIPSFTAAATVCLDEPLPRGATVDPNWFYPETAQWGYTEDDMLTCDSCKLWVHAGCAGVDEDEYEQTSNGEHPIYNKEFLCRMCCRQRCTDLIGKLQLEDTMMVFAEPVTDKVAPNYHDVITKPMDLLSMAERAKHEEYNNYAWVREMFELMVLNALTFNRFYTSIWNEAERYYNVCLDKVFSTLGKAAPPGKYHEAIQQNFADAEEAQRLEEIRVQQDKSVEKKDLVAGANIAPVNLPDLREEPPDQPSCLPFTEVKLKPVDAYFNSWMDCCFTCGSSGAADTMLFCVDCGEAFHSFCVNAPIQSMDESSVAAWRCPNCKICEISGDEPQDELKMLFCEMCDRAFSLDLLDPPLQSAPPGLWICGQCVDCQKCGNTTEPRGASLKYWSRDPQLCYRCGGCDGLVDQYRKSRKCPLCSMVWRDDDTDLAHCVDCDSKVHARCDVRAKEYLWKVAAGLAISKTRSEKPLEYKCPRCYKKHGADKDYGKVTRANMYHKAWQVINEKTFFEDHQYSNDELHDKLMTQIDWKTRNLWRDEYRKVVLEGVRFLGIARETFGDPRSLMDRFWQENFDIPSWTGQRATRFIQIAKKFRLETSGFQARRIESCVHISKLAASWLQVVCSMMGLELKRHVKGHERVCKLLVAPNKNGSIDLPFDSIRCERNRNIIGKDEWLENFEPKLKLLLEESGAPVPAANEPNSGKSKSTNGSKTSLAIVAKPLCGWNEIVDANNHTAETNNNNDNVWMDSRECCLCHLCGDDDAGTNAEPPAQPAESNNAAASSSLPSPDPDELMVAPLGRLLPMGEGLWVHASCALWSSEVWESPSGGHVNAMEKARSRGAQLKCFGCGRPGATVGCMKANCSRNYHFPCAYACGSVFTTKQQMYCADHKAFAPDILPKPSIEHMKTLIVSPEKSKTILDNSNNNSTDGNNTGENNNLTNCIRVGALVVHSLGEIEQDLDGFHTENYITPPGYTATRIFWSTVAPRKRTVYILQIVKSSNDKPIYTIIPGDKPSAKIRAHSFSQAYSTLMDRVDRTNFTCFSHGDLFSNLPTSRHSRKKIYGLNGPQFFGFGLNQIRKALEGCIGVEAVVAPLTESSPSYRFCYMQPSIDSITSLQRKRAAMAAERALENPSGCARTEGIKAIAKSGGSGRITRALVRRATNDEDIRDSSGRKTDPEKAKADKNINQAKYRAMTAIPIKQRLAAKRSHIHGWGLFTKIALKKDSMIVEYLGETVRQCVADKREKEYEISGEGSCYMFRLDMQRIVDATMIGCMARFMNHCCQPNAYAKVISVETDQGQEKKIVVFALRDIAANEEITYDYKFPVEDGSLRCTCGAPNCIGRMN